MSKEGRGGKRNGAKRDLKEKYPKGLLGDATEAVKLRARRKEFEKLAAPLALVGLKLVEIKPDGNCLFRAVAHQVVGDQEQHASFRAEAVKYMRDNKETFFGDIIVGDKERDDHCNKMEKDAEWGDDLELTAMARLWGLDARVHRADSGSRDFDYHGGEAQLLQLGFDPIREHWDSVVRQDHDMSRGVPLDRKRRPDKIEPPREERKLNCPTDTDGTKPAA